MSVITVVQGDAFSAPIQTYVRGGSRVPAVYAAGDTLNAFVYQGGSTTPLFTCAIEFYTANGTQDGWGQGQVFVSYTNAQGATLIAGGLYTLIVTWSPLTNPSQVETIVRTKLSVEPVGVLT